MRKQPYTRWTPQRDASLCRLYPELGATAAARLLGATRASVRSRVEVLGISGRRNRPLFWTAEKDSILRARYRVGQVKSLADELGCSPSAVKQRARKLGIDSGRAYTQQELDLVGRLYLTHSTGEIAELLYGDRRRWKRVFGIAKRLRLKKWPSWPREVIDRFSASHAAGLSDRQIACEMADVFAAGDRGRDQVKNLRKRFGLGPNLDPQASGRAVHKQLRTLGITNPADLRARAHARFAAAYGLPVDLRVRQVQICIALTAGPLTLPEIKQATGITAMICNRRKINGTPVPGKTGTYLSDLIERGLVCSVPTGISGPLPGPRRRYMLTAMAMELMSRRDAS